MSQNDQSAFINPVVVVFFPSIANCQALEELAWCSCVAYRHKTSQISSYSLTVPPTLCVGIGLHISIIMPLSHKAPPEKNPSHGVIKHKTAPSHTRKETHTFFMYKNTHTHTHTHTLLTCVVFTVDKVL